MTEGVTLHLGDCVEVMAAMEPESVDAIICDPPYGLDFMGKKWDTGAVAFDVATWASALRVLKPGGHLLAFGGTRTFHRLTCAIEDAGFEVRDCLSWLYGSGFPKSLDVSKAIDKAAGAEREVVGPNPLAAKQTGQAGNGGTIHFEGGDRPPSLVLTAPATPEAAEWEGWGTALKPAWEPCVVARKPLIGTVAANVLRYGTGGINVDGCRVGTGEDCPITERTDTRSAMAGPMRPVTTDATAGRWPANVVLDEAAAERLDAEVGELHHQNPATRNSTSPRSGVIGFADSGVHYDDRGGPSRFFYTAKASKKDRGVGNTHPTVKPTKLMRWLVRMVTPPGGVVLDPFAGSGSTLVAARMEGFDCIGIEREPEYHAIILSRLEAIEPEQMQLAS